jgi:hypothetical protein
MPTEKTEYFYKIFTYIMVVVISICIIFILLHVSNIVNVFSIFRTIKEGDIIEYKYIPFNMYIYIKDPSLTKEKREQYPNLSKLEFMKNTDEIGYASDLKFKAILMFNPHNSKTELVFEKV